MTKQMTEYLLDKVYTIKKYFDYENKVIARDGDRTIAPVPNDNPDVACYCCEAGTCIRMIEEFSNGTRLIVHGSIREFRSQFS